MAVAANTCPVINATVVNTAPTPRNPNRSANTTPVPSRPGTTYHAAQVSVTEDKNSPRYSSRLSATNSTRPTSEFSNSAVE